MPDSQKSIRLLVLEDQPVIRDRLETLFSANDQFDLVGIFDNAEDALARLAKIQPDIFLVDLELPGMSGEELIPIARNLFPEIKLVVFTVFEDQSRIVRLLRHGIRGYLLKDISDELLLAELRVIEAGGATLTERVAQKLLDDIAGETPEIKSALTARETEVMNLIALGMNYKAIAEDLDISPHTVRRHLNHIYEKLEVNCKIEALNRARQLGLI